jgi:hypothetical protein
MFAVRAAMRRRHRRVLLQNANVAMEAARELAPGVEATSAAPAMAAAVESEVVDSPADECACAFPATAVLESLEGESAVVVAVDDSDAVTSIDALPVKAPLREYEAVADSALGEAVPTPAKVKKRGRKPQKSDSTSMGRRRSSRKTVGKAGENAGEVPATAKSENRG